jgi:hypothetical protein
MLKSEPKKFSRLCTFKGNRGQCKCTKLQNYHVGIVSNQLTTIEGRVGLCLGEGSESVRV